ASENDCSQTIINNFFSYFLTITNFQFAPTFTGFAYEGGGASPGRIFQAATGSVSVVPAPIVGAGLPGLILAGGVLLVHGEANRLKMPPHPRPGRRAVNFVGSSLQADAHPPG